MFTGYSKNNVERSRTLRKNMTRQERHLWYDFLRGYPVKFYRQRAIGNYIVDFYCSRARLVIELDGSQHYTEDGLEYDSLRTDLIEKLGLTVIRFANNEIDRNFEGVCMMIDKTIKERMR